MEKISIKGKKWGDRYFECNQETEKIYAVQSVSI